MKKMPQPPPLAEPEITTYENTELTVDVAFTVGSDRSSRQFKADFRRGDARRTLRHLLGP